MAPRRGGSSGGSSYNYSNSSIWLQKSRLLGYGFTDALTVAGVVFAAIYMVALFGVAIWNLLVKKRGEVTRLVLRVKFGFAMLFMLIYFAFTFIALMLLGENTIVYNVYHIIRVIIIDLFYLAHALLLLTIFALVFHFFSPSNDQGKATKRKILLAHYALCAVLFALFCTLLGLGIYRTVNLVSRYGSPYDFGHGISKVLWSIRKLDVAFNALLFVASFEILLASVWLIPRSRAKQVSTKPTIFFLTLVAIPYFIHAIVLLAYSARSELGHYIVSREAFLAEDIITGACVIFVFAGLVVSATKLDKMRNVPWNGGQSANPVASAPYSGGPPMQGYQNGYMPGPGGYVPAPGLDPYALAPVVNGAPQGYAYAPQMQHTPSSGYGMSQQTQSTHYEVTGQHGAPVDRSMHGQAMQHK